MRHFEKWAFEAQESGIESILSGLKKKIRQHARIIIFYLLPFNHPLSQSQIIYSICIQLNNLDTKIRNSQLVEMGRPHKMSTYVYMVANKEFRTLPINSKSAQGIEVYSCS